MLNNPKYFNVKKMQGFSLVELVITMGMIAILTAMALPSYQQYAVRARRHDAVRQALEIVNLETQFFENYKNYSADFAALGIGAAATATTQLNNYNFTIVAVAIPPNFSLTAAPALMPDPECGTLTYNSDPASQQYASAAGNSVDCWAL